MEREISEEERRFHEMETGVEPDPELEFKWTAPTTRGLKEADAEGDNGANPLTRHEMMLADDDEENLEQSAA